MAVFNRCSCATLNSTKVKTCKACGKRLGKNYYIQYSIEGKRKTEKIGDSIGYAREVLAKRMSEVRDGKFFGNTKTIRWVDFFNTHYKQYCESHLTMFDTARFFSARDFKLFDKPMTKITRTDIEAYRAYVDNGKRAKATINRYMNTIRFAFNYAETLQLIDRNPARKLSMYKEEPSERKAISLEDEEKLLDACRQSRSDFLYSFVMIAIYTGMRYSEITNIKWSHVSFDVKSIMLYKTKTNESREIPIIDKLMPVLNDLYSLTHNYEYVFSHPETGARITQIKKGFRKAVERAGLDHLCIHEMRHTMITRLAASGASVPEIQQISGHKTAKMVQRYTHVGLKEAQRTINRLSEFLGASSPQ